MITPSIDERLTRIGPAGSPDPDALVGAYALLSARLDPDVATAGTTDITVLDRRRARRRGLVALVASAAAVAILAVPVLDVAGSDPASSASAAEVLRRAAQGAASQTGDARDAAYWHTALVYSDEQAGVKKERVEEWAGRHDWSVISRSSVEGGRPYLSGHSTFAADLTWAEVFALPTDPGPLERALRRSLQADDPDPVTDGAMWSAVVDLLTASPAPPDLRQGLWEVAAQLPGARSGGEVTDSTGRPGELVIHDRERLILDPETGLLLEMVWDYGKDIPPYRATYLDQGPAETTPHALSPDLPPGCTLDGPCDNGRALEVQRRG